MYTRGERKEGRGGVVRGVESKFIIVGRYIIAGPFSFSDLDA